MDIKQFDKRVKYHARRFKAKTPLSVLCRYEQRLQMSHDMSELQRHAFHVASWVVELPPEQMSHQYDENLSAVLLLGRYLKTLQKGTPLGDQLLKLLDRVWEPVRANLHEEIWASLANHLRHHVPEPDGAELEDDKWIAEINFLQDGTKAARLMNKSIQIWRNQTCPKTKESYVFSLEESLAETGVDNTQQICRIFRRAVAALSPPRLTSTHTARSEHDSVQSAERISQDLQGRLRKVVFWCLDRLDLADPKIKPSLLLLQGLLQRFQELLASPTQGDIGCKKHWLQLQALARKCEGAGEEIARRKRVAATCKHGVQLHTCRVCRPCHHDKEKQDCAKCSACVHGKLKRNCGLCNPCPHGKAKKHCAKCSGCIHGKLKRNCGLCNPCPHGKAKQDCAKCSGCVHGKLKRNCGLCNPCPHGKAKKDCAKCIGCIHGKLNQNCGLCNPCPHGGNKYKCHFCKQDRSREGSRKEVSGTYCGYFWWQQHVITRVSAS